MVTPGAKLTNLTSIYNNYRIDPTIIIGLIQYVTVRLIVCNHSYIMAAYQEFAHILQLSQHITSISDFFRAMLHLPFVRS